MISFKQLRYALAVEKNLHFRKAAEECSVSQSAMSSSLLELERNLGFAVFERDNKKVLVTPIGKMVLAKARQVQFQVDELENLSCTSNAPLSYPMSIGFIPTICPYILPKVLPSLEKEYPAFKLSIIEERTDSLLDKVRLGQLDAAVIALPYPIDGLLSFEFWQEDFYWIVHSQHSSKNKGAVAVSDIPLSQLMLLDREHCLTAHILNTCGISTNKNLGLNATSLNTLVQLVLGKAGTTVLPQIALDQLIPQDKPLNVVKLKQDSPHRKLTFVVRPNYPSLHNIEALIYIFKRQLSLSTPAFIC